MYISLNNGFGAGKDASNVLAVFFSLLFIYVLVFPGAFPSFALSLEKHMVLSQSSSHFNVCPLTAV